MRILMSLNTLESIQSMIRERWYTICRTREPLMGKCILKPTLWRTCRAVRNPLRLRLLKAVFEHDGEFCVRDFAKLLQIDEALTSVYLRQLNARGLIGVSRERIRVVYNTAPDRTLPDALKFREALRAYLSGPLSGNWEMELIRIIDAFSHPNRLAMLIRLAQGPATIHELFEAAGVVVKSIYHHLRFFTTASLIAKEDTYRSPTIIHLVPQTHPVTCSLLELTLNGVKSGHTYYNPGTSKIDQATRTVLRKLNKIEGNPRKNWATPLPPRSGKRLNPAITAAHQESD